MKKKKNLEKMVQDNYQNKGCRVVCDCFHNRQAFGFRTSETETGIAARKTANLEKTFEIKDNNLFSNNITF
jgi:hypothetical protein